MAINKKFGLFVAAAALMLSACAKEASIPVPAGTMIDGAPVPAGRIVAKYVPDNPEAPARPTATPDPAGAAPAAQPTITPQQQVTPTFNLTLTVAPSGTLVLTGTVAGPAPAGAGDRWVGPGRQMLNVVERIATEDGGATYTWSAAMTIKFSNGKVVSRPAKPSTELITIVIGNAQVSGEDNNVTVTYSDFNAPFGSYNWVENRPGQMTVAEVLSLAPFKEQVLNSHKANCGSGCKTVHVVVLNTAGVILYEGDL